MRSYTLSRCLDTTELDWLLYLTAIPCACPARMPDRRMQTTLLEPLSLLPSRKTSIRHAQQSYDATEFLQEFDRVQVLGDDEAGHFGCVNALAWDYSGGLLASGSDDTRICIWKLGQDAAAGEGPKLGMDLQTVIQTGSVRFYLQGTRLMRGQTHAKHLQRQMGALLLFYPIDLMRR